MKKTYLVIGLMSFTICANAYAEQVKATVYNLTENGQGDEVGTILFQDTKDGLQVRQNFYNLPAGPHGIHVHENGSCDSSISQGKTVLGGAAGSHYDPNHTGKHLGPNAEGHKGDLPVLMVGDDGKVDEVFYLQGVAAFNFKGRSIIIHAGGDNYKDTPEALGGGGARIACGLIQ